MRSPAHTKPVYIDVIYITPTIEINMTTPYMLKSTQGNPSYTWSGTHLTNLY